MKVENEKFVTIEYTLKNDNGEVIDTTEGRDPLSYVHGQGRLLGALEDALEGKAAGDSIDVSLSPEQGYGEYRDDRIFDVPRSDMAHIENLKEGMQLHAQTPNGIETFTIKTFDDENVKVDGNHPLAGANLHFSVNINEVREATEDEINPPHACGCNPADGHKEKGECNSGNCTC